MHRHRIRWLTAAALAAGALAAVPSGAAVAAATPAAASAIGFSDAPGTGAPPTTLGSYTVAPFAADSRPVGTDVSSVAAPSGSLGLAPSLEHDQVGDGWATWSNGYTGDVYSTQTDSVTLTLPASTKAFYFYAEPDQFQTFTITATNSDGTSSGAIPVAGQGGAQYFGFYSTDSSSLTSITVTSADPDGFAVGEFGISSCGYTTPADWNTKAVAGLTPGVEPLNLIVSGCSTVPLPKIERAVSKLYDWDTGFISTENADVTGTGYAPQQISLRLGGTIGGNKLSLTGREDHARLWQQPKTGAWFVAASYETACINTKAGLEPLNALHHFPTSLPWHCIDGGPGSYGTNGYGRGASTLSAEIVQASLGNGWYAEVQTITRPTNGVTTGEAGVTFDGTVYVVTVDYVKPSS